MVQKRKKDNLEPILKNVAFLLKCTQDEIHSFTSENLRVNTILYYMHKIEIFKCSLALKYTGTCSFNST